MLSLYCNKWVRCLLKAKLTIIFSYEIITYIVAIKSKCYFECSRTYNFLLSVILYLYHNQINTSTKSILHLFKYFVN